MLEPDGVGAREPLVGAQARLGRLELQLGRGHMHLVRGPRAAGPPLTSPRGARSHVSLALGVSSSSCTFQPER